MPKLPQKCLFLVQPLYSLFSSEINASLNYRTVPGVLQAAQLAKPCCYAAAVKRWSPQYNLSTRAYLCVSVTACRDTMQFVAQFINPLLPLFESATFCVRQRPQIRSIGLVAHEISEFAAKLVGITVHRVRSWDYRRRVEMMGIWRRLVGRHIAFWTCC
jgi:hypothetical protein